ncbi:enediyne biosynthesis protein E4 [Tenacibaculum sp. 190524A05c]|uniref:VCBS repeat-containing protein n=1 Tax=Tenacibaculum platacis TaxID=3137852 RepID=UPI0031FA55AD
MRTKLLMVVTLLSLILSSCKKEHPQTKQEKSNHLFKKLTADVTGLTFKNEIQDDVNHNIINYIYYYNGGGVSVGDFNNDNLPDLFFISNRGDNKLFLNKGNLNFEDITEQAGVKGKADWQTGATIVDINNDGYLDIYVCAVSGLLDFKGHNELYINNGDNTFSEKSKEYNLDYEGYSTQAYFFDYDKDDDLDIYIVNHAVHTKTSHGPALLREKRTGLTGDVLLQNNNNKFTDYSEKAKIFGGANGYGLSASIADFNNDGWDDIYVCNDFHEDDYYYLNNQDGTFTESLGNKFSMISRFSMGSDAADINGDGFQDLITLDMLPKDERAVKESEGDDTMLNIQIQLQKLGYKDQYARNMLQINNSGNFFNEEALFNGVADTDWSWSPLIADYNNDGHQDLFVANGILRRPNDLDFRMYVASTYKYRDKTKSKDEWLLASLTEMPKGTMPNQIFKGNSEKFENKNNDWIEDYATISNGATYADLDLDGDLDLITNNMNDFSFIYENTTTNKNFIKLNFNYSKGNKNGIGTKAIVYSNGKQQFKQLFNSRGFISSVDNNLHFGLDTINKIDSIKVIWPNNKSQIVLQSEINKLNIIKYNKNTTTTWSPGKLKKSGLFTQTNLIDYNHKEDKYNDFYVERLIPYKVSTSGPALSIGDIDNNGYEDVFIGNGCGTPAQLFLNNGNDLVSTAIPNIEKDAFFEDTCSTFFDADNDGDLDLYVGTGINQRRNWKYELDRLYLNDNGNFTKSNSIPANKNIAACVKHYDYDNDGDIDLFVGNRSNPNDFGQSVDSYILINNGQGNFEIDKNFKLNSHVTDAIWTDLNKDGTKDLVVTTEWDYPRIYINNNGKLTLSNEYPNLMGLWQTVTTFDVDKDGDQDILLGNWGTNTKFKASVDAPLNMYYSDFDGNGKNETVLAYNINGKYYPIYSKDELASQMNVIKKRFVKYKDYATKTIDEVLTKKALNKAHTYFVNNLSSGYIENDNGKFDNFKELPKTFQLAPLNTFSKVNINSNENLLVFGNTKSVNTYHGGYESIKGLLLSNKDDYSSASAYGIEPFEQEIRNSAIVNLKDKKLILIVPNNDTIKSYVINEN